MAVTYAGNGTLLCLHADTKPTTYPTGTIAIETDTGNIYCFTSPSTWSAATLSGVTVDAELNTVLNQYSVPQFTAYKSGSNYKYRDWSAGTTTTNASFDTLLNNLLTAQSSAGAAISIMPASYLVANPISVPTSTGVPFWICGSGFAYNRAGTGSVAFQATGAFPNQRYMIESVAAVGSAVQPHVSISGLYFYNPNFKTLGTVDVGGIKLEGDGGGNWQNTIQISNCQMQYMWRGIHILGVPYGGLISDVMIRDDNVNYVGDSDIRFEMGGHPDRPKLWHIRNVFANHVGQLNNSLYLEGGYNYITDYKIDGTKYVEAPIAIHGDGSSPGSYSNKFVRLYAIDLNTPSGTNVGAVYITGAQAYDNHIISGEVGAYPKMVNFANGAFRNYVELNYFGNPVSVEDTGSGLGNVVKVRPGSLAASTTTDTNVFSTISNTSIIDERFGRLQSVLPSSGRIYGVRQLTNTTGTGASQGSGLLSTPVVANGTGAVVGIGTDNDGARMNWGTGTNNTFARAGWWGNNTFVERQHNPSITFRFRLAQAQTGSQGLLYMGFINVSAQPAAGTSMLNTMLDTKIGALFGFRSTDTTWMIMSNNAQATSVYTACTGLPSSGATDISSHTLSISLNNAVPSINWTFDGASQAAITDTTNSVPPSTTNLYPVMILEAQTATSLNLVEKWVVLSVDGT